MACTTQNNVFMDAIQGPLSEKAHGQGSLDCQKNAPLYCTDTILDIVDRMISDVWTWYEKLIKVARSNQGNQCKAPMKAQYRNDVGDEFTDKAHYAVALVSTADWYGDCASAWCFTKIWIKDDQGLFLYREHALHPWITNKQTKLTTKQTSNLQNDREDCHGTTLQVFQRTPFVRQPPSVLVSLSIAFRPLTATLQR
jgi:hypothetical protein